MEEFLNVFIAFNVFIIGTLFGSFFSLAIYRLPKRQDILFTRSYCPNCKHNLEFFDLIPIISYVFKLGKCKYCGQSISIRYLLLEVFNGILFLCMYILFNFTSTFFILIIFYIILFLIIGSYVMSKQIEELDSESLISKDKLNNIDKKNSVNSKKGVFISELVIAAVLFTAMFASVVVIIRNNNKDLDENLVRMNATYAAVSNIEKALATSYDSLYSFNKNETIDNVEYNVDVSVYKYSDENVEKEDVLKTIDVNVEYQLNGKVQKFNFKALKERKL